MLTLQKKEFLDFSIPATSLVAIIGTKEDIPKVLKDLSEQLQAKKDEYHWSYDYDKFIPFDQINFESDVIEIQETTLFDNDNVNEHYFLKEVKINEVHI